MVKIQSRPKCSSRPAGMLLMILAAGLAGCAGDDFRQGFGRSQAADEGLNTLPSGYKADILAIAHSYLNNPRRIRDASISEPFLKNVGGGRGERYVVCVRFNAMNSDGKYTGIKSRIAIYRRGKLDQFTEATPERLPNQKEDPSADPCNGVIMQPFPELEKLSP
jgi:hypothetical protein